MITIVPFGCLIRFAHTFKLIFFEIFIKRTKSKNLKWLKKLRFYFTFSGYILIAGDARSAPLVQFRLLHSKYHLCSNCVSKIFVRHTISRVFFVHFRLHFGRIWKFDRRRCAKRPTRAIPIVAFEISFMLDSHSWTSFDDLCQIY